MQRESRIEKAKRTRKKQKAGKAFTKQFGGDTDSSESTSGSRAALYKGEMGRKHKQSNRMQSGSSMSGPSARRLKGISFNPRNPKFIASVMVAACLVASCAFLYPTAKQYYETVRQHDKLVAEYEALQYRNGSIESEVTALGTDAGIEDKARKEFGWVREGENSVSVYGLPERSDETNYNKAIPAGSVEAPETWYSPVLDVLFGIE